MIGLSMSLPEFSIVALSSYFDGVFDISPEHGFLPYYEPSDDLPDKFRCLLDLSKRMPIYVDFEKKEKGLLAEEGALKREVEKLPNFVNEIKGDDPKYLQTLYRLYTFISSAYLLEPAYHHYLKTGVYGKGERMLPENLAQPLVKVADALGVFPWLDYHYSYCLCNVVLKDNGLPATWENMKLLTSFAGTPDETGFISVHVDINQNSPQIIESIHKVIRGFKNKDIKKVEEGYKLNYETMVKNNERRREIYKASNPNNYNELRMFIMGSKGNEEIFGDGIVYENVYRFKGEPVKFRGQTGAQDDIIPTEDIFTGVVEYYPKNRLTEYLMELRDYRPNVVMKFMKDLASDFKDVKKKLIDMCDQFEYYNPLVYLLLSVEQIYRFRNGHWMMVQQYIMKQTKYEKATGGTPITSWLPNQIKACLDFMEDVVKNTKISLLDDSMKKEFNRLKIDIENYKTVLNKQLEELTKKDYDPDKVYDANKTYKEY